MMKYFFAGIGGCGSTHLLGLLQKEYTVDAKPDTFFVRNGEPYTPKPGNPHQLLSSAGLLALPAKSAAKAFFKRTSYKMKMSESIETNLVSYISSIKENPRRTAFFNSVAKMNFFSDNSIDDVVYLVRDPLDAYISFTKQKRHFNLVEKFGGINAEASIDYYITAWNDIVSESQASPNSVLLRHEHFSSDVLLIPEMAHFSGKWKSFKNSHNVLLKKSIDLIRVKSEHWYKKVYEG